MKNKFIIINTISTFILCFISHYIYNILPSFITSLFFPVNESIWEHMKMLYTSVLLNGFIEYYLHKRYNILNNNFTLSLFIKSILIIPIFLIIYLPLYFIFKENLFISIIIMLISIIIINILVFYLFKIKKLKYQNIYSSIFIIIMYIIMIYLTYNPPKTELFYDPLHKIYGINLLI